MTRARLGRPGTRRSTIRRAFVAAGVSAVLLGGAAACSDDGAGTGSTPGSSSGSGSGSGSGSEETPTPTVVPG